MSAVYKREMRAYFSSMLGYIYLFANFIFLGFYFWLVFSQGYAGVPIVVTSMATVVLFLVPVLTMRLLSEDRRQKVDQILLTSPVKLVSIVLGKFFAALTMFAVGFAPTVVFEMIMASYAKVNVLTYLYALFGMLLFGGTLIAIGMFISSLTESTALSAILTLITDLVLLILPTVGSIIDSLGTANSITIGWVSKTVQFLANRLQDVVNGLSVTTVFDSFSQEVFSIKDIVYFLSFIAVFLFLTVRSLEKRRWS